MAESPTPPGESSSPSPGRRQLRVSILPPPSDQQRPGSSEGRRETPTGRTGRAGSAGRSNSNSRSLSRSPVRTPSAGKNSPGRSSASVSSRSTATPEPGRKGKGSLSTSSAAVASTNSTSTMRKKINTPSPRGRQPSAKSGTTRRSLSPTVSTSNSLRRASHDLRKRKIRKAINSLITAEEKARGKVETQYYAEWVIMMQTIALDSFDAQRRFIMELGETQKRIQREYGARAERAEEATAKLIKAINHLLESINTTGTKALEETNLLEKEIPFTTSTYTPVGEILSCAKDPSSLLRDPYVPVKPRDPREPEEIAKIESFFKSFMKPTVPQSTSNTNDENRYGGSINVNSNNSYSSFMSFSSNVDVNSVVVKADEAYNEAVHLSEALSALIDRTHRGLQQSREMIRALHQTLNENSTRVKVADDLLRETTGKHRAEVDSAIRLCGQFGMELRRRMDSIEENVRDALDELIQRSTEISIENNAFQDQAQLLLNKENAMWKYMSRMEKVTVEQGKLLRDVRLKLLQLWKERCGDGDEERATLKHSGLPTKYQDLLESCDRDTLLRLLHFVSLNGDGVAALLIGALDEYANFMLSNTIEAQEVVKRSATQAAVTQLLEKLYEEGEIKCNSRPIGETLADTIKDMVLHYNTFMETQEKQQRRLTKTKSLPYGGGTVGIGGGGSVMTQTAFFDRRTPVPEEYAVDIASRPSIKIKRPAICEGNATRNATDESTDPNSMVYTASLPTIKAQADSTPGGTALIRKATPPIETSHILSYLQRSHPSELDTPGTATIVGYGRWGGKMAKHCENNNHGNSNSNSSSRNSFSRGISKRSPLPPATSSHVSVHQFLGKTENPPPGVPPRKTILRHMLEDHSHDVETLFSNPKIQCKCIRGEDEPFLKLQRELFEEALS
ncbi:uncharacterized protein TM35_000014280 [Trypanosoma theileri]|uniref:Uncharacterized protein n=1 Tax=Trypanosoma theileri TaxID=67003 RepID=A0A1X0P9P1_9TRYP|nr:uncharacterized protein TM35_000014280 [Trypanosoma theileri]ORC93551.1 hypothetical protein TM35_000014280 [Trypanosoma theileri]